MTDPASANGSLLPGSGGGFDCSMYRSRVHDVPRERGPRTRDCLGLLSGISAGGGVGGSCDDPGETGWMIGKWILREECRVW